MTPARILIVEDDRVVARDIAQQLHRIGHSVVGVTGRAEEAVMLARTSQPSLVLMNLRLEGRLDGIELAEQIRTQCDVPVVLVTAHAYDHTVPRVSHAEPFGYLRKPFDDSQLRTTIEIALFRHRIYRKDGQLMWVRLNVSLGSDSSGGPLHAIGIVEDISEQRRLEQALQLAKEAAETSNRAKDEFLAHVSHEIRTPMNAILGMTELVLDTELSETQRQSLRTVKSAASGLLAIINDLLDFSEIEADDNAANRDIRAEAADDTALPLRVLVAEDNAFNAQLVRQLLATRGHAVRIASDGREALRLALTGGFDLLLLDLHMPELDGFQVIVALREQERGTRTHLRVIALTAQSRAEDRQRCFDAGMDDFLAKPIHAAALWSAIEGRSSPAAPDAPVPARLISSDVLLAACGGDAAILRQIRDGLRAGLPGELAAVRGALRARDARQLRELAHGIAGMLAAFSTSAAAHASELEDAAAAGDLGAAALLVERLAAIAPRLLAALASVSVDSLTADLARHRA